MSIPVSTMPSNPWRPSSRKARSNSDARSCGATGLPARSGARSSVERQHGAQRHLRVAKQIGVADDPLFRREVDQQQRRGRNLARGGANGRAKGAMTARAVSDLMVSAALSSSPPSFWRQTSPGTGGGHIH